jgi:hypothetical protein
MFEDCCDRSFCHHEYNIVELLSKKDGNPVQWTRGLRYKETVIHPGAQTERRGDAGPVRDSLGGKTSPAALVCSRPTCAAGWATWALACKALRLPRLKRA